MKIIVLVVMLVAVFATPEGPKEWEAVIREFLRGAKLDHYISDSVACVDALHETGSAIIRMNRLINENKKENSTVDFYPDVFLSATDLIGTASPLARSCFYSSIEAKEDFKIYTDRFESWSQFVSVFGTSSLKNYNELRELFNTFLYDINYIHNST